VAPAVDGKAVSHFLQDWNIDTEISKGGLLASQSQSQSQSHIGARKVFLLQRKEGKVGAGLGKTTGWIHRATLKKRAVEEMSGCKYVEIIDEGLVIERKGKRQTLPVDTVIICAGQECFKPLMEPLVGKAGTGAAPMKQGSPAVFLIGGSLEAGELDAKRAIDQGTRLAAVIETSKTGQVFNAPIENAAKLMQTVTSWMGGNK
jgi:2,4-dienoyl-CoA reductase (NADPH2)